jgi:hypothetical protein
MNLYAVYGKRENDRIDMVFNYIIEKNSKEALKQANVQYNRSGWRVTSVVLVEEGSKNHA